MYVFPLSPQKAHSRSTSRPSAPPLPGPDGNTLLLARAFPSVGRAEHRIVSICHQQGWHTWHVGSLWVFLERGEQNCIGGVNLGGLGHLLNPQFCCKMRVSMFSPMESSCFGFSASCSLYSASFIFVATSL